MTAFEELFAVWQKKYPFQAFIRDGIVDAGQYERPHVLFILRDMNYPMERDLCRDLRDHGSGWKTWNNAARWTAALLDGQEDYPRAMPAQRRAALMRRVAVINLKKEGGGPRADGGELLKAVRTQHEEIFAEIEMCDPQIIICCGLSAPGIIGTDILLKDYVLPVTSDWHPFSSISLDRQWGHYDALINGRWAPVIGFCHPQVTKLCGARGHEGLLIPLYRDMLYVRDKFLFASS